MNTDQRLAGDPRDRLCGLQSDEQRTDKPGRVRHRDAIDARESDVGLLESCSNHRHDVQDVSSRRQLWNDSTVTRVHVVL